ncbi:hypothetical protein [Microcystis aeruginosa]|uniref:hypothetical protein n=1 Tax=Microcystis aeruginosa TaxID=1126 RepID=UPI00356B6F0F
MLKKFFVGVGCGLPNPPRHRGGRGVWGFTDFEEVNYLIFREKVQEFPPRSLPYLVLFDCQKV